jgi:DNA-binding beta-propeller fold protein YncE
VEVSADTLRAWLQDGAIDAEVRNTAAVGVACDLNRHTLRVRYNAASDVLDFGTMVAGSSASRRLILSNSGSQDLRLMALRSDRPEVEVTGGGAGTLAPGASRVLDVRLTAGAEGAFESILGIDSDDPGSPHRAVPIRARVAAPPAIVAAPAALEAALLEGHAATPTLSLTNRGDEPLEVALRVGEGTGQNGTPACAPRSWVTAGFSSGNLVAFDASTGARRAVATGLFGPGAIAVDPIGRRVIATEFNSRLAIADLAGGAVTRIATGVGAAFGVVLDPSGRSAFVAGDGSGGILRVDLATGAPTPIAADLEGPRGIAIDAAGRTLWVVEAARGALSELEIATGAARLITDALPGAFGLAVDRQGSRAYVSLPPAGAVVAVDLDTGSVTPFASGLEEPRGLALDDADGVLLVAEFAAGRLTAIDLATGQASPVGQGIAQATGAAIDQPSDCLAGFVGLPVRAVAVAAGATAVVPIDLDATGLPAGPRGAVIEVGPARPFAPIARVPVNLAVAPRPRLQIAGLEVVLDSLLSFTTQAARTVHALPVAVPPGSAGTLEVTLDGDFGNPTERATLSIEGTAIGSVGNSGTDCAPATGRFEIAAPILAAAAADGRVEIAVQNSSSVSPSCTLNRHRIRLRYRNSEPEAGLDLGALQPGEARSISIVLGNSGSLPLHVGSIAATSPVFAASESSLSLAPGETRTLEVRGAPAVPGPVEGLLRVTSDDPDRPVAEVRLRATGLEADSDRDGIPDRIDVCPFVKDPAQGDRDADGRGDLCDNCPATANASQTDANADGSGDACQPMVVVTGVREDGGARLEVAALASDPQGDPLRGSIVLTPLDPASPPLSVPFEGGLPRTADIAGLAPDTRVRLALTVTDGSTVPVVAGAEFLHHSETILVIDNDPVPAIAVLPAIECDRPNGGSVRLDGRGSADPDSTPGTADDIVSYAWSLLGADGSRHPLGSGAILETALPLGTSTISLVATDASGESAEATTEATVRDSRPPALRIVASPAILWPPDHRLVPVRLTWEATDLCDPAPVVTLAEARSSDGNDAGVGGIGPFTPDPGGGAGTILLSAERDASGPGRRYVMTMSVRDRSGNESRGGAVVTVPHNLAR